MMQAPGALLARLETVLATHGPLALAVSGGVDSMTLAWVACRLQPDTEAFHALSPAVPAAATARVRHYAQRYRWQLQCITAGEMADPQYRANPGNRCYFCKTNLYQSLHRHTRRVLAAGTNLDDLRDYRPGLLAASEQQVVHPLVEAGITKQGVRQLAAYLGLADLSELPASPCLASRITTGLAIDADLLPLIDRTEAALRELLQLHAAHDDVRCRIRPAGVVIEADALAAAELHASIRHTVTGVFAGTRFAHLCASISIEAYRQGSAFIRLAP
jgi:uncharacterized protein